VIAARLVACVALLVCSCAPIPKPLILGEVDQVSQSDAAARAKAAAMPTWALAEKRRLTAHELAESGPMGHAEIVAEEALATYEEAVSLVALAEATQREETERLEVERLEKELAEAESAVASTLGEIDALEARLRIAKTEGSLPGGLVELSESDRRALADVLWQAKITCASSALLAGPPAAPDVAKSRFDALEAALAASARAPGGGKPKAIDPEPFFALRAECLRALVKARGVKSTGKADGLAGDLSRMMAALPGPTTTGRDERGVLVSLQDAFEGGQLSQSATERLIALARVLSQNPSFPVAIVVHRGDRPSKDDKLWNDRLAAVVSRMADVRAERRVAFVVDGATSAPHAKQGEPTVDILFISPEAL
jgi:hypothetical protein